MYFQILNAFFLKKTLPQYRKPVTFLTTLKFYEMVGPKKRPNYLHELCTKLVEINQLKST